MWIVIYSFFLPKQVPKSVGQKCVYSLFSSFTRGGTIVREETVCPTVFYTRMLHPGRLPNYCAPQKTKECSSFFPRKRREKVAIAKYILLHSLHLQCDTTHFALLSLALILGFLELDGQNIFLHKGYIESWTRSFHFSNWAVTYNLFLSSFFFFSVRYCLWHLTLGEDTEAWREPGTFLFIRVRHAGSFWWGKIAAQQSQPAGLCRTFSHVSSVYMDYTENLGLKKLILPRWWLHDTDVQDSGVWEEKAGIDVSQIPSHSTGRSLDDKECSLF